MKKLVSLLLAVFMVFSLAGTVFAAEEAPAATENKEETAAPAVETSPEYLEFLKAQGLVKGDNQGNLMLDKEIDRASFAALLVRAKGLESTAAAVKSLASRFSDMNAGHWANGYANVAAEQGWMKGNEKGEFMPAKTISYAEIATTLVRFLGTDTAGFVYPTSFLAKAHEMGLFEGVREIADYAQAGIREDIFRMIYNAVSKKDFGKYVVYKAIVLENNRVAPIANDEIKIEVLNVVQSPNQIDENRRIGKNGDQYVLSLKDTKYDVENLLGKVANFTLDENNKLIKVEIDNTYNYIFDEYEASTRRMAIGGENYNVIVNERYYTRNNNLAANTDNRLYRTYITSARRADNYSYEDFLRKQKEGYARVTVKDGMVIFIDAFDLKDIAPIKEVAREGKDIYYYDDTKEAAVNRVAASDYIIGYTEKDGFRRIEAKDIKAEDVIHFGTGFTLVRQDAKLTGKLEKTFRDRFGEGFIVDGKEYRYADKTPFMAVYSFDGKYFRVLRSRAEIELLRNENVTVLLDIFGGVQLVTSDKQFKDNFALIAKVVSSQGMEFYAPNGGDNYRLRDNYDARYINAKTGQAYTTSTQRYDAFHALNLVYVTSTADDNIGIVAKIKGVKEYEKEFKDAAFEERYQRYLTVGGKNYRFGEDTAVFALNKDRNNYYQPVKATMEEIIKNNEKNAELKAYVLTEKEFGDYYVNNISDITYNRFANRENYAKVIIFTNVRGIADEWEKYPRYGFVNRLYNYTDEIVIDGTTYTFAKPLPRNLKVGDLVSYKLHKEKENLVLVESIQTPFFWGTYRNTGAKLVVTNPLTNETKEFELDEHVIDRGTGKYVWIFGVETHKYPEFVLYTDRAYEKAPAAPELTADEARILKVFKEAVEAIPGKVTDANFKATVEKARSIYDAKVNTGSENLKKAAADLLARLEAAEKELAVYEGK